MRILRLNSFEVDPPMAPHLQQESKQLSEVDVGRVLTTGQEAEMIEVGVGRVLTTAQEAEVDDWITSSSLHRVHRESEFCCLVA